MRARTAVTACALGAVVVSAIVVSAVVFVRVRHDVRKPPPGPPPPTTFAVRDGRLYEATGKEFIMRGASHMHTSFPDRTASALANLKSLGANAVRVELSTGAVYDRNEADDVANVIATCRHHRLVCVLEVFDTTGYGQRPKAITQAQAVDYWLSVQSVLTGQEKYVILDIANEPYVLHNHAAWPSETSWAISRLRDAGFNHTLMVTAPDWGQDNSYTMRDNAAAIFNHDPHRNVLFSVHMYGVFNTAAKVRDYIDKYLSAKVPLVIGEFGYLHSDGDPDEDAIMAEAHTHGIGYLGWSWSGNGGDVAYLDMVSDFDPGRLTWWGEKVFNSPHGIRATAHEASVYAAG